MLMFPPAPRVTNLKQFVIKEQLNEKENYYTFNDKTRCGVSEGLRLVSNQRL